MSEVWYSTLNIGRAGIIKKFKFIMNHENSSKLRYSTLESKRFDIMVLLGKDKFEQLEDTIINSINSSRDYQRDRKNFRIRAWLNNMVEYLIDFYDSDIALREDFCSPNLYKEANIALNVILEKLNEL